MLAFICKFEAMLGFIRIPMHADGGIWHKQLPIRYIIIGGGGGGGGGKAMYLDHNVLCYII